MGTVERGTPVILFDLDDTLLDDLAAKQYYMPRLYDACREHIRREREEFYSAWKAAIPRYHSMYASGQMTFEEQRFHRVRDAFANPDMPDQTVAQSITAFDRLFKEGWCPFADTHATLDALVGFRKGIVTNGNTIQQQEKIDHLGIRSHFDCIIISEQAGFPKPDRRIFDLACRVLNCTPADCIFVGDSWEIDVIGASRAGMAPVWINRYARQRPEELPEVRVIEQLRELVGISRGLASLIALTQPRRDKSSTRSP